MEMTLSRDETIEAARRTLRDDKDAYDEPQLTMQVSWSAMRREQLLGIFTDLHLPNKRSVVRSYFSYVEELPKIDLTAPLFQSAVDALCYAELGSKHENQALLRQAQVCYVRALPQLANELARSESHKLLRKDQVLGSIVILTLCELFDCIAKTGTGYGWISHVNGAEAYVQAYGRQAIATDFGMLLFHNLRHTSLFKGLVRRKAVVFAQPEWLRVTREEARTDPFVALYNLALQVPGLLERCDRLRSSREFSLDFKTLCKEIALVRSEMCSWYQRWYGESKFAGPDIVDISEMEVFSKLCPDLTIGTAFRFDSVGICSQHLVYFACRILLDHTLMEIYRVHSNKFHVPVLCKILDMTESDLRQELHEAALSFCHSIPYCCESEIASLSRVGTFFLRTVGSYFKEYGYHRELTWSRVACWVLENGRSFPSPESKLQAIGAKGDEVMDRYRRLLGRSATAQCLSSPSSTETGSTMSADMSESPSSSSFSSTNSGQQWQPTAKGQRKTFDACNVSLPRMPAVASRAKIQPPRRSLGKRRLGHTYAKALAVATGNRHIAR